MEKLTRQAVRELSLGERMKMELIAALLHSPQLLLLDEPTIGLDVVAQVTIQKCLRDYHTQARRDDAPDQPLHARRRGPLRPRAGDHPRDACLRRPALGDRRAVRRDRSWSSSSSRREAPDDLDRFGEVVRREGPWADIKVERTQVAEVLAAILDRHAVADVSVEDPPLEEIIARVFEEARTRP